MPGWRERLYARLAEQPVPLLVLPDALWTAASLWAGARQWTRALRAAGLARGDRVVCALPAGAAFVQLLVAALWDGYTLAVTSPRDLRGAQGPTLLAALDARLLVSDDGHTIAHGARPGSAGWPDTPLPPLRPPLGDTTSDACLLLRTSGTGGAPHWVALSDTNVFSVLDSHATLRAQRGACVLSVVPWHHAFGLVLGLLSALLDADDIVRDGTDGRNLPALLDLADAHPITHVDLVPLLASRLFADPRGAALLHRVQGGTVGGAPVSSELAARLAETRLRVGYGQTEAAPGVALGAAGEWSPRFIGRAVGCEVRIDDDGVLAFRGPNACMGAWRNGVLQRLDPARWVSTGDVVEPLAGGAFRYVGRAADTFKLPNGCAVDAPRAEDSIRRAWPMVCEVLVHQADGDGFDVLLSGDARLPDVSALRATLGSMGRYLARVRVVDDAQWRRTPKGDVDRRAPLVD